MVMDYTVKIDRDVSALCYCLERLNNEVDNIDEWRVSVNAGGFDYGIYFNFDIENMELEICNQSGYKEFSSLDEVIDEINKNCE
mgnify:CR=1 FL=1